MARITSEQIVQINEIYHKCHNYAQTAREVGVSPASVKKYVKPDYVPAEQLTVKRFDSELPEFDTAIFKQTKNWGDLCVLSEEERKNLRELWLELSL